MMSFLSERRFAELSGIKIPAKLLSAETELTAKVGRLKAQLQKARSDLEGYTNEAFEALRDEATLAGLEGKDTKKLNMRLEMWPTMKNNVAEQIHIAELTIPKFETQAAEATAAVDHYLRDALDECRSEMQRQFDRATEERVTSSSENGYYRSSPPKKQSKSRLAVCEKCLEPVALFDPETIKQPVTGEDFERLDAGFDAPPFAHILGILEFKCPRCSGMPFLEKDRILTTAGYFAVPEDK